MSSNGTQLVVTNLPGDVTEKYLELVFQNARRHGGGPVKDVTLEKDKHCAIITFEASESVDLVLSKGNTIPIGSEPSCPVQRVTTVTEEKEIVESKTVNATLTDKTETKSNKKEKSETPEVMEHTKMKGSCSRDDDSDDDDAARKTKIASRNKKTTEIENKETTEKVKTKKAKTGKLKKQAGEETSHINVSQSVRTKTSVADEAVNNETNVTANITTQNVQNKSQKKCNTKVTPVALNQSDVPIDRHSENKDAETPMNKTRRSAGRQMHLDSQQSQSPHRTGKKGKTKGAEATSNADGKSIPSSASQKSDKLCATGISRELPNLLQRTVKAKVTDVEIAQEFFVDCLDISLQNANYDNNSLLLDGLNKYLYVTFQSSKDAQDFCHVTQPEDSYIISAEMATEEDMNIYRDRISIHGYLWNTEYKLQDLRCLIEKRTSMQVMDVIQENEPRSVMVVFEPNSLNGIHEVSWKCATAYAEVHLVTAPVFKYHYVKANNLSPKTTQHELQVYVKCYGGEHKITYFQNSEAVIQFLVEQDCEKLISRKTHNLSQQRIFFTYHYPCLSSETFKKIFGNAISDDQSTYQENSSEHPKPTKKTTNTSIKHGSLNSGKSGIRSPGSVSSVVPSSAKKTNAGHSSSPDVTKTSPRSRDALVTTVTMSKTQKVQRSSKLKNSQDSSIKHDLTGITISRPARDETEEKDEDDIVKEDEEEDDDEKDGNSEEDDEDENNEEDEDDDDSDEKSWQLISHNGDSDDDIEEEEREREVEKDGANKPKQKDGEADGKKQKRERKKTIDPNAACTEQANLADDRKREGNRHEKSVRDFTFNDDEIFLFQNTKLLKEVEKKHPSIEITLEVVSKKLVLKGYSDKEINDALVDVFNSLSKHESRDITETFSAEQLKVLKQQDVLSHLNDLFEKQSLAAFVQWRQENIILHYDKNMKKETLLHLVTSQVTEKQEHYDKNAFQFLESEKGQGFLAKISQGIVGEKLNSYIKLVPQSSCLLIVAAADQQKLLAEKVKSFLIEYQLHIKTVPVSKEVQELVQRYMKSEFERINSSLEKHKTTVKSASDKFILEGPVYGIEEGVKKLHELKAKIHRKEEKLEFFGIKEFLQDFEGQTLLQTIEHKHSCIIKLKSEPSPTETKQAGGTQGKPVQPVVEAACTTVESCSIVFVHGDITGLTVDAIVNPIDAKWKCRSALSKALISRGAQSLQSDLEESIEPGPVIETPATGLSQCHAIINLICPVAQSNAAEAKNLEQAVIAALNYASQQGYTSIALPVVGTGKIFQFTSFLACRILVRSIEQHLEGSSSNLRKILLGDTNGEIVEQLVDRFEAFDYQIENRISLKENNSSFESPRPSNSDPKWHSYTRKPESRLQEAQARPFRKDLKHISFSVVKSEMTKQQTDVIVIAADKSLDLNKGHMAQAVLKYGGPALQQELKDKYTNGIEPGDFAQSSGGQLKCQNILYSSLGRWRGDQSKSFLSKHVLKLMDGAEQLKATSLSMPALGTGFLGYPVEVTTDVIIETIKQFAEKNPSSSLKSVSLVVSPREATGKLNFEKLLLSKEEVASGGSNDNNESGYLRTAWNYIKDTCKISKLISSNSDHISTFGNVKLEVKKGDITDEKCDAIVCGVSEKKELVSSGAVSKVLVDKCGKDLQDEYDTKKQELVQTGLVKTKATNLNCQVIFHISNDKFARKWDKGIVQVLTEADKNGFTSIALPAFGTGIKGADYQAIKKVIHQGVEEFSRQSPKTLTDIRLVVFSEEILNEFLGLKKKRSVADLKAQQAQRRISDQVNLEIYCSGEKNIKSVSRELTEGVKKAHKKEKENSEEIKKLNDSQVKQLLEVGLQHNVKVSVKVEQGCISMKGFRTEGFLQVQKLLKKLEKAVVAEVYKTLTKAVTPGIQWMFCQAENTWTNFDRVLNSQIEKAYQEKLESYDFNDPFGRKYRICFSTMKEHRLSDKGKMAEGVDIKRSDILKAGEPLPQKWEPMNDSENLRLVTIIASSDEYKNVQACFAKDSPNVSIKKIERIQNKSLYQMYKAKKREMDQRNPKGHENEKRLFHGTSYDTVTAINETGFSRNYRGKNAVAYGNGVYFSGSSAYSCGYASADPQGNRKMYLARVLTGETTQSKQNMNSLPNKPGTTIPYDSGIGGSSNMFIIYHDAQCYPEYLITF